MYQVLIPENYKATLFGKKVSADVINFQIL